MQRLSGAKEESAIRWLLASSFSPGATALMANISVISLSPHVLDASA